MTARSLGALAATACLIAAFAAAPRGASAQDTTAAAPDASPQCRGGPGISADAQISACTAIVETKPDSASALTLRGMAYAHKGDYDRAIADYARALQLAPGFGMAEGGLAEAKAAKARLAGGQALGDPRAWCQGKALPQEGFASDLQISGCTTLIQTGKEKRPALAQDYFNRASAYDFAGDADHALPDFDQAIKLAPKNAAAYYRRGTIYWLKADYDRAIADFTRAIKVDPKQALYFSYRGYAHYAKGQFDLAINDYDQVLKLQPGNPDAFLNRSLAYNGKADYDHAVADSDQAIKLSHTSEATVGYDSRGDAHFHKGDFATAIDDYDHALTLWPQYPQAMYGRGAAKMRSGDGVGGQADMDAARKLKPDVETAEAKLGIKP
jgi:tetratricopeptide (TPR) repeat protein